MDNQLLKENKYSLSEFDKHRIKQAILENASKSIHYPLEELAESLCNAMFFIDSYKR